MTDKPAQVSPRTSEATRASLREIFDAHARFIWRTARHLGVREADLEDICQEVFLTAFRRLPSFEGRSSIRTWLYGICLRVTSDYRRRAHLRREVVSADPPARAQGPDQDEPYAREQARVRLGQILERLDPNQRTVFVLYEIEELTMKEVASIVGCPLQTAYSRLHAARARVIDGIQDLGDSVP